ncbi:MAG TPA: hypothetical protein VJV87_02325, partial [Sphingomicrobium sp.]|nr:hypothetical protein [Sphingomicrobium sp.]
RSAATALPLAAVAIAIAMIAFFILPSTQLRSLHAPECANEGATVPTRRQNIDGFVEDLSGLLG